MREGSLEAPTRHPHLCTAFPTLFDLVDNSRTMEVDGVDKRDFRKVVDQCYLCDMCYMTKCPYVPPHPWNVDFPHLMLRAKDGLLKKDFKQQLGKVSYQLPCHSRVQNMGQKTRKALEMVPGTSCRAWVRKRARRKRPIR